MIIYHLISITFALFIDFFVGDPPTWPHPVKWIGKGISFMEKKLNKGWGRKVKGVLMVFILLSLIFSITFSIVQIAYHLHPLMGIMVESLIIAVTVAQRSLKEAGLEVYEPLKKGDMAQARVKLSYIVGRDTEQLDEGEIVRGTVETIAENTSDGITAPLFWGFVGGAPLAMIYRTINTFDSMVGYKSERFKKFGWASAKLDDLVNWIPSRLTGCIMILVNTSVIMSKKRAWSVLIRDARRHPSPNSGWLEAAVAALLGVQLGGINYYKGIISNRAKMGESLFPLQKDHILKANKIVTRTTAAFLVFLWIGGILLEMASTWF